MGMNGLSGRIGDTIGIVVDIDLPIVQMLATVAHEMIHVKQQAKGQLQYDIIRGKEVAVWRGTRMKKNLPHLDRPWEIEAYSRQELLARRFSNVLMGVKQ